MAQQASPPVKGNLSLYANLLDPSASSTPGTISSAPVTYKQPSEASPEQDDAAKKQQPLAASLRFQPTKRPQIAAQKAKAKAIASKFSQTPSTNAAAPPPPPADSDPTPPAPPTSIAPTPAAPKTTTIADWAATASDDDINNFYGGEKRPRGGRKKRKKNRKAEEATQNWDDIYDPTRPNNYDEYKHSEEKIREVREWKDVLYAHRIRRRPTSDYGSEEDERRPINNKFALPFSMSFAPPPAINADDQYSPPPPPPEVPDDPTGEDAYARRMRLSGIEAPAPAPPPPYATTATPPPPPTGQIARAPVRYSLPPPSSELPSLEAELGAKLAEPSATPSDADIPRSTRPGQAGFAERLLSKYGWTKGSGLGAQGTGIINPLYAKVDKRKKKSDAEGGGYATPAGTGKIMGGQKSKAGRAEEQEESKFGTMSDVVRLEGMLKGMDLDEELTRGEGGIMQEVGEECGEKYGSVERVYIHRANVRVEEDGPMVFVRFTSQLSALRAVQALNGRVFGGNTISAKYWDKERFEQGDYE